MFNKRAQISGILAVVIAIILITAVAIPVVDDVVTNQAFTGTTKTITDLFVIFLAIGGLVVVAGGFFMGRGKGR